MDDSKIKRALMHDRQYQKDKKNAERTARMRDGVGMSDIGGTCVTENTKAIKKDAFYFYKNNIEQLNEYNSGMLKSLIDDYTEEWVIEALKECVERNKRNLKYATAILKSWKADGFKVDTRKPKEEAKPEQKPAYYNDEVEPDPDEGKRMNAKEYKAWKAAQNAKAD